MSKSRKVLIVSLCLLSCSAIALQLVYESGAVVQGFPISKVFMLFFWWQLVSIPVIIFGSTIGLIHRFRHSWTAPASILLAAIYPGIIAATALWPTTWAGWAATLNSFPKEAVFRFSVACLPAFFTVLLCAVLLRQLRRNQVYQGV